MSIRPLTEALLLAMEPYLWLRRYCLDQTQDGKISRLALSKVPGLVDSKGQQISKKK